MTATDSSGRGVTAWLTGLPSAGKSSIAEATATLAASRGLAVQVLDGDELRRTLCAGLGFSREDRITNVRRIGYVAELLARNGIIALVAVIAPHRVARDAVRAHHERAGTRFLEVHVDAPVEICSLRDRKGLYARQRAGTLTGLTGVDDGYDRPEAPDLRLFTATRTVDACAREVLQLVTDRAQVAAISGKGRPS